jgi:hypothetical protein
MSAHATTAQPTTAPRPERAPLATLLAVIGLTYAGCLTQILTNVL